MTVDSAAVIAAHADAGPVSPYEWLFCRPRRQAQCGGDARRAVAPGTS